MKQISAEEGMKRVENLEKEVQGWKEHILGTVVENKEKKIAELEELNKKLAKQATDLNDELEKARKQADHPLIKAFTDFVEDMAKKHAAEFTRSEIEALEKGEIRQAVDLVNVKTKIGLKEEHRKLPDVSSLTAEGKILRLVRDGKLDTGKRENEIKKMLEDPNLVIFKALVRLVDEHILIKTKESSGNVNYKKDPDVYVEVVPAATN